ncbi:MAG: aldose epimerase family protein [Acidobacteriota bacterium]
MRSPAISALVSGFLLLSSLALSQTPARAGHRAIEEKFGQLGESVVKRYTLVNNHGMVVKIMSYGATITELRVPDRDGNIANVVLGSDSFEAYARRHPAAASVVGRFANRIAKARFVLDGIEYQLTANNGPNHIHGGRKNFSAVIWTGEILPAADGTAVRLRYRSPDDEEGFPGNLDVSVTCTLTDNNELHLDYAARTDRPTVVNLTNHAYFNLAGAGDVLNHVLWLAADEYTPADQQRIPTGEIASVSGTPLDFRTPATLGSRIEQLKPTPGGYDHNYVLRQAARQGAVFARVYEPKSGRVMEVTTTQPGVQLYTANHLRDFVGTDGVRFGPHGGFCLETQHYPDSPNKPQFPSTTLRPGEAFRSRTTFKFSTRPPG